MIFKHFGGDENGHILHFQGAPTSKGRPEASKEPFGLFRAIWEPFGSHLGAVWEPFEQVFEDFRADLPTYLVTYLPSGFLGRRVPALALTIQVLLKL